jgi:hypothetical protein
LDNNGRLPGKAARSRVDTRGLQALTLAPSFSACITQLHYNFFNFLLEIRKRGIVCRCCGPYDTINGFYRRDESSTNQLSKPATEKISIDDSMARLSHNNRNTRMRKQGVGDPNIQMLGSHSSPCFLDKLDV